MSNPILTKTQWAEENKMLKLETIANTEVLIGGTYTDGYYASPDTVTGNRSTIGIIIDDDNGMVRFGYFDGYVGEESLIFEPYIRAIPASEFECFTHLTAEIVSYVTAMANGERYKFSKGYIR